MDHPHRLRKAARACYYTGWTLALFAFLDVLFKMDKSLLSPFDLTRRNLLEASFLFFLISIASAVRAMGPAVTEKQPPAKSRAASA